MFCLSRLVFAGKEPREEEEEEEEMVVVVSVAAATAPDKRVEGKKLPRRKKAPKEKW